MSETISTKAKIFTVYDIKTEITYQEEENVDCLSAKDAILFPTHVFWLLMPLVPLKINLHHSKIYKINKQKKKKILEI